MKCALVVGHKPASPGAENKAAVISEYDYNEDLAIQIVSCTDADIEIVVRQPGNFRDLPAKINALEPGFIISLHCNAYKEPPGTADVSGTEALYYHKSAKGQQMAQRLSGAVSGLLGLNNRGAKGLDVEDRGGHLLRYTHAPCVILEPFFIDNDDDLAIGLEKKDELAALLAQIIEEFAGG